MNKDSDILANTAVIGDAGAFTRWPSQPSGTDTDHPIENRLRIVPIYWLGAAIFGAVIWALLAQLM